MKPSNPGANFSISNLQKFTLNDTQVWFIRISIDNLQETVAEIMQIIADVSWIEGLTSISKESFMARARPTIDVLIEELTNYLGSCDEKTIETIGETVVSVSARSAIERILQYKALPIAELIKQKVKRNPGFDFHHEKDELMIVFGEAKYESNNNAYNKAISQIVKFIADKKHLKDIPDIDKFLSQSVLNNMNNCQSDRDRFCYSAAFSTVGRNFDEQKLINNIKNNNHFKKLVSQNHRELVLVAVDING